MGRTMGADLFTLATGTPAVLAHRGTGPGVGLAGLRENTLDALLRAVDDGADWVECDVQFSADGDLVLAHNVVRDGRAVRGTSTADLRSRGLDTLADAHARLPAHIGFDLDVKVSLADLPGLDRDLFRSVADWAAEAGRSRPVLIASFCPTVLETRVDVPLGWMANRTAFYYESVVSAVRMGAAAVGVHAEDVLHVPEGCPPAEEVDDFARRHDLAVLAWGVEPRDVGELVRLGVTGLCADDVPGAAAALAALRTPVTV